MSEEVWVSCPGFERYEISDLGRVRSLMTGNIMKPRASTYNGYVMVGLVTAPGDGQRTMRLHGLVARAFIPNPEGKTQVNHIDGNRLNNAATNLEWVTPLENRRNAVARGTSRAATNPNFRFKLSASDIAIIKTRLADGDKQIDIARDFGVNNSHISRIKRGAAWDHSHQPTVMIGPAEMQSQCVAIVQRYARGCVTNHICGEIVREIRGLSLAVLPATTLRDEGTER